MKGLTKERREAYVEVLEILDNMETYYKEKIPLDLIKFFKENASKEYEFNMDLSIPFEEHNLKDVTLNVLAMLNLNYWCETEEEKQKWTAIYEKNEKKHEEDLQKKYNLDNVFNKRKEEILEKLREDKELEQKRLQEEATMLEIAEYEETLFRKIINKIKKFLNKY